VRLRFLPRVLFLFALGFLGLALVPQAAQGSLGAVELLSQGVGFQWTYDQPGSPIPAKPTGEMEQAYSTADYSSGPTTHGLSSIWWPGSAGANFGPVYGLPADPVRAEAFSPGSPHKQSTDYGPYTTMDAKATPAGSEAATTTEQSEKQLAQAIAAGNYSSSASTLVKGNAAISEGTAAAHDISMAGGLIHIDSVVTRGRAVTNGKNGTVTGGTVVTGATVQGQGVTIDQKGVHVQKQTVPVLDPINSGAVQQALEQAGISMKVAKPIDDLKGSNAERTLGGLVVTFQDGALNQYAGQIPGLSNYVNFNQTITMNFGAVTVNSDTLGGFTVSGPPPAPQQPPAAVGGPAPAGGGGGSGSVGVPSFSGSGGLSGGSAPVSSGGGSSSAPTVQAIGQTSLPLAPAGTSVSGALAAVALLLAFGSSRILKIVADRALAAKAAERCPLERP
jgi:hypothetical protein